MRWRSRKLTARRRLRMRRSSARMFFGLDVGCSTLKVRDSRRAVIGRLILGSVRTPGGSRGLQSRRGVVSAIPGGFDSHPLPCIFVRSGARGFALFSDREPRVGLTRTDRRLADTIRAEGSPNQTRLVVLKKVVCHARRALAHPRSAGGGTCYFAQGQDSGRRRPSLQESAHRSGLAGQVSSHTRQDRSRGSS